jgi:hypothetical protein
VLDAGLEGFRRDRSQIRSTKVAADLIVKIHPSHLTQRQRAGKSAGDARTIAPVAALAKQLGFAPVALRMLNEGGALVHARGRTWGPLIFQDLFKKAQ